MSSRTLFGILCLLHLVAAQQCKWGSLNLAALSNSAITCTWDPPDNDQWQTLYSPCGNRVECEGGMYTAGQINLQSNQCEAYLAEWDASITPTHSNESGVDEWTFEYLGGKSSWGCEQRRFQAQFICDTSSAAQPYNRDKLTCGEYGFSIPGATVCVYTMTIYSNSACIGDTNSSSLSDTGGLSGGWITIIIFICVVFVYCLAGYVWNGYRSKQWTEVERNVPQYSFWSKLPMLVMAGCVVSKETLMGLMGKDTEQVGYHEVEP